VQYNTKQAMQWKALQCNPNGSKARQSNAKHLF